MDWSVVITTAPRGGESTLPRTVQSLEGAGWAGQVNVLADRERNAWQHWKRALELALQTPADCLLMVQDDVIACRGLRRYLEEEMPGDSRLAWASCWCPQKYGDRAQNGGGWFRLDRGPNTCGAVCMAMPRTTAVALLRSPMIQSYTWTGPRLGRRGTPEQLDKCCIDGKCGAWAEQHDLRVYYHFPSLVDHIGVVSSLGSPDNPPARTAANFVGEPWTHE